MIPVDLGLPALLILAAMSAAAGILAMLVFLRWTDAEALRRSTDRIVALVMEHALFIEDPVIVFRIQRDLLRQNGRLLLLLSRPALAVTIAFMFAFPHLEALFGRAALRTGDPAVITAQLRGQVPLDRFVLSAPSGIVVETAGVRVIHDNQFSWRIRPREPVSSFLEIRGPGVRTAKRVAAGPGLHYLSPARSRSWIAFFFDPVEPPLSSAEVSAIAIAYPPASILHLHWMIWFLAFSTLAGTVTFAFAKPGRRHRRAERRGFE